LKDHRARDRILSDGLAYTFTTRDMRLNKNKIRNIKKKENIKTNKNSLVKDKKKFFIG